MDIEEQYDKIYRFCYYRVHNKEIAEDLTQETFLRFMNSRYEERGEVTRYLYTIARNLCIEESRHIKTEELPESISDGGTINGSMTDPRLVHIGEHFWGDISDRCNSLCCSDLRVLHVDIPGLYESASIIRFP